MLDIILVEDNLRLQAALQSGLEANGEAQVIFKTSCGEEALEYCIDHSPEPGGTAILMDVQLAGEMNGVQTAVAIRREFPRFPVVFYSIQDDDSYYRDFRRSGILSHYAYVRKSNYLLPKDILPLLKGAARGQRFIDAQIEDRIHEVRVKDENNPLALLEPNEQVVVRLLARGLTNEQIATRLGFRDKRTISRTNGQIYAAWGLSRTATDEKVARTRVAIIAHAGRLLRWEADGTVKALDEMGKWTTWDKSPQ